MKKSIIILSFLCLAPVVANCQALIALLVGDKIKSDNVQMGLFIGEQGSYINGANTLGFKPNLSFTVGAYVDVKLGKSNRWILQNYLVMKAPKGAEGLDVSKESLSNDSRLNDNMEMIKRSLTYVQLTPVMRFCATPALSLGVGPYIGFKVSGKDTYSTKIDGGDLVYTLKTNSNFSTIDAGAAFDLQYRLLKGKGIQLNMRFERGLTNIYKDTNRAKGQNMAFHFGVGIPMGRDKK